MNKTQSKFVEFFKDYSKNVDKANNQHFWKLSDDIILKIIAKTLTSNKKKNITILDAGGGTGRWIEILEEAYPKRFNYILYDNSESMLKVALNKKKLQELDKRLEIVQGDIQKMSKIKNNSLDFVISIYNPISFIQKPLLFFNEIRRILKTKGIALIMGQSFPNAIYSKINNYLAEAEELEKLDTTESVKWNEALAPLRVFSKESFNQLARKAKLNLVRVYGVPVFVQPGSEDFDPENIKRSRISTKLEDDPKFYKQVLRLEMKYNFMDSMANRGMNLMAVVQK